MIKFVLALLVGVSIGYTIGYGQGASGAPSVKERMLGRMGAYRIRDDQRKQEQALDQLQQTRPDSADAARRAQNAPRP